MKKNSNPYQNLMSWLIAMGLIFLPITSFASQLTIHAVGDILLHKKLQQAGMRHGFDQIWQPVIPFIQQADIAYANLEGPVAENVNRRGVETQKPNLIKHIYTSFPMFNYHPALVPALKSSGFDIVSTANNHSLDRFAIGIDKTISTLRNNQLSFMGTRHRTSASQWYTITDKNNIKLAWISCTQDTNGIADKYKQVLYCYKKADQATILNLISALKPQVDGIIITPHWGTQYQHRPTKQQRSFAKRWLEQGALIILGSHPHVIQPIRYYQTKDGRQTLIAYSLGNFVSNQGSLKNRSSGVLAINIQKQNKQLQIKDVKLHPTYMQNRGGKLKLEWVTSTQHPSYRLLRRIVGKKLISSSRNQK